MFLFYSLIQIIPLLLRTLFHFNTTIYLKLPFMDWQLGCLVVGFYLSAISRVSKRQFILTISIFISTNIITSILTYLECNRINRYTETYYGLPIFTNITSAICMFIMAKYISKCFSSSSFFIRLCCFIGALSLNIYLIHPLVMAYYQRYLNAWVVKHIPYLSVTYIFYYVFVSITSVILAYILQCVIRLIKSLINTMKVTEEKVPNI